MWTFPVTLSSSLIEAPGTTAPERSDTVPAISASVRSARVLYSQINDTSGRPKCGHGAVALVAVLDQVVRREKLSVWTRTSHDERACARPIAVDAQLVAPGIADNLPFADPPPAMLDRRCADYSSATIVAAWSISVRSRAR